MQGSGVQSAAVLPTSIRLFKTIAVSGRSWEKRQLGRNSRELARSQYFKSKGYFIRMPWCWCLGDRSSRLCSHILRIRGNGEIVAAWSTKPGSTCRAETYRPLATAWRHSKDFKSLPRTASHDDQTAVLQEEVRYHKRTRRDKWEHLYDHSQDWQWRTHDVQDMYESSRFSPFLKNDKKKSLVNV